LSASPLRWSSCRTSSGSEYRAQRERRSGEGRASPAAQAGERDCACANRCASH
jgi:hypothetical protein